VLFPTHLLVAVGISRLADHSWVRRRLPSAPTLGGMAGRRAALPDIVDKPLGALGVVDTYHSVGHSVLLVPPRGRRRREVPTRLALAVGWGRTSRSTRSTSL